MLLLSRLAGRKVFSANGGTLGCISDVSARPTADATLPTVDYFVLSRRRQPSVLMPWPVVNLVHPQHIQLDVGVDDLPSAAAAPRRDDEIMLVRDVLDTQVVDLAGQRLTRVADVVLARHDNRLQVIGVEVGFDAVLRRLGLTKLANRLPRDAIAWTELHLTSERGHAVQLKMPRSAVHRLDARALAVLVSRLGTGPAAEILAAEDAEVAADVIRVSHPDDAERMLRAMAASTAAEVVAAMPRDHAAHWRNRLSTGSSLRQRHLLRSALWPRRRLRLR